MDGVHIKAYGEEGFQLDNGIILRGSTIVFPDLFLLWKPKILENITPDSISPIVYHNPPIGIIKINLF